MKPITPTSPQDPKNNESAQHSDSVVANATQLDFVSLKPNDRTSNSFDKEKKRMDNENQ